MLLGLEGGVAGADELRPELQDGVGVALPKIVHLLWLLDAQGQTIAIERHNGEVFEELRRARLRLNDTIGLVCCIASLGALLPLLLQSLSSQGNFLLLLIIVVLQVLICEVIFADRKMTIRDDKAWLLFLVVCHLLIFLLLFNVLFVDILTVLLGLLIFRVHLIIEELIVFFERVASRDHGALLLVATKEV